MSDETVKLPFWATLRWSFQWALAVVLRHQVPVAALMAGGAMFCLLSLRLPELLPLVGPLFSIATIILALLTHNEVLRGTAAFDRATFGPGGVRILTYLLDMIVLALMGVLLFGVLMLLVVLLQAMVGGKAIGLLGALAGLALFVTVIVLFARLMLRLPSRALGTPLPWREAWRLGAGNSFTLVIAPILLALPLSVPPILAALSSALVLAALLQWVLVPLQVILSTAFLAVAYGQLTSGRPAAA